MASLTEEQQAIYETIKSATTKAATEALLQQRTELESSILATVDAAVKTSVQAAVKDMRAYTDGAEQELRHELEELRTALDLGHQSTEATPRAKSPRDAEIGPDGHRLASTARGMDREPFKAYVPPPARGMRELAPSSNPAVNLLPRQGRTGSSSSSKLPFVDFPHFNGENPKLWQIRCEDYFHMFDTEPALWISVAGMQFEGPAARWLQAVQHRIASITWSGFCELVLQRFGRNQHQSLIRRLYRLVQTGSVDEYIDQFAELVDQLAAYETAPDPLHYTTRFLDGLKPHIR